MGPTTQNSTQKRRAKTAPGPHAAAAEKERILQARREKNREAQHVFRKRRQAAEAAMGRRFKRLEDVVEEMSSILIGLFDDILANEALVTQHPSIITCLKQSMGRVLALTKEVAAMDDDPLALVDDAKGNTPEQAPDAKAVVANAAITPKSQPSPSAPLAPPSVADTSAAGRQSAIFWPANNSSLSIYSPIAPISAGYTPTDQFAASLPNSLSPDDALGDSGWDTFLPKQPEYTFHPTQETSQLAYSFPIRLIEISLTHGYALITKAPLASIQREFGRSLRYRRREEIIAALQWALGPGRDYMLQNFKYELLEDPDEFPVGYSGPPKSSPPEDEQELDPDFITAAGVYKLLRGLGATMLDADTMEIQIRRPSLSTAGGTTGHLGWLSLYPDAFETSTTKLRLHVPQLMTQLMHISVCSETGPRYPQRDVWRTIEALARLA